MTCCSPLRYLVILCPHVCSSSHMMMFDRNGCCNSYCCLAVSVTSLRFSFFFDLCVPTCFCGISCKCNSCLSVTANQKELAVVSTTSLQFWQEDRSNVFQKLRSIPQNTLNISVTSEISSLGFQY